MQFDTWFRGHNVQDIHRLAGYELPSASATVCMSSLRQSRIVRSASKVTLPPPRCNNSGAAITSSPSPVVPASIGTIRPCRSPFNISRHTAFASCTDAGASAAAICGPAHASTSLDQARPPSTRPSPRCAKAESAPTRAYEIRLTLANVTDLSSAADSRSPFTVVEGTVQFDASSGARCGKSTPCPATCRHCQPRTASTYPPPVRGHRVCRHAARRGPIRARGMPWALTEARVAVSAGGPC